MLKNGENFRFGVVGCGSIGPTHAAAIGQIPGAQLVALSDVDCGRARELAGKHGVNRIHADQRELFADAEVDVVCLCTPSGMHANGAVAAMEAGKHVIVEKPMEISLAACDRMIAAERATGKKLSIICQHRFDTASGRVKQAIEQGRLGKIVACDATVKWWRTQGYYDSGDWRGTWAMDGGGALMNQGIHTLDLMLWLAGPVKSVYAQTRTAAHERIEVEDVCVAVINFAGGAVGTLLATTAAYDGLPARVDIFGENGSAIIEGDRLLAMKFKDGTRAASELPAVHAVSVAMGGTKSVKDEAGERPAEKEIGDVWGDAHRMQIMDVIGAIKDDRRPMIDGTEGRVAVETILAIYESARTGQVVEMSGERRG